LPAESAAGENYFSAGAREIAMAKRDKKKSGKSSKKKVSRFKAAYREVLTDRVKMLLASLAVIAFALVIIIYVFLK
jgi:hypothetical protein